MEPKSIAETPAQTRNRKERFEQLPPRLAQAYANVPEDEGMAEIDAAVFRERHG